MFCLRYYPLRNGARSVLLVDTQFCILLRNKKASSYYGRGDFGREWWGGHEQGKKKKSSRSSNFFLFEATGPEENKSLKPPKLPPEIKRNKPRRDTGGALLTHNGPDLQMSIAYFQITSNILQRPTAILFPTDGPIILQNYLTAGSFE